MFNLNLHIAKHILYRNDGSVFPFFKLVLNVSPKQVFPFIKPPAYAVDETNLRYFGNQPFGVLLAENVFQAGQGKGRSMAEGENAPEVGKAERKVFFLLFLKPVYHGMQPLFPIFSRVPSPFVVFVNGGDYLPHFVSNRFGAF